MDNLPLIIDVYEPFYFKDKLRELGSVAPLPTGDYVWIGIHGESIGIERKDSGDLLNSFQNGRLTDQLSRLITEYTWPILLIEGSITPTHDGFCKINYGDGYQIRNFRYVTIESMLLEAQLAGVFIVRSANKLNTVHLIKALYEFSQRPEHHLLNRRMRPFQIGTKVDEQVFLLMGLPGFGEDSAKGLIETFGSPIAAMAGILANPDLALTIKGIGKQKIDRARKVLMKATNGQSS